MSALWTSDAIATAVTGVASDPFEVSGVAFDSREVGRGDLFIALKGEVTDGHRFVEGAFAQGAAGAIVSDGTQHPHVLVRDTTASLDALGRTARSRTSARIAGVTGSVGKTSTKEALAAALARANRGPVHRSVKSYNNQTGVPLSLARMPAETAFGVFEMGMNHAGEIAAHTRLVRPHVALVTAIAPAHIENLGSIEAIADAKGEVFEGLEPDGIAIIPFDTPLHARLHAKASAHAVRVISFGSGEGADVRAIDAVPVESGTLVTAALPGAELSFTISQPGAHWVSNALAVLAAVQAMGGDLAAAGLALADFGGLAGRGAQHRIAVGDGEALLIDESYNANTASMAATLAVLGKTDADRRIAVLGEMRELGEDGPALHASLAGPVEAAGVDFALLVGDGMLPLSQALAGRVEHVHAPDAATALDLLSGKIQGGDAILIKGSNAVGLSRLVEALTGGAR